MQEYRKAFEQGYTDSGGSRGKPGLVLPTISPSCFLWPPPGIPCCAKRNPILSYTRARLSSVKASPCIGSNVGP